jgi:environmental stress-induced protein Ves
MALENLGETFKFYIFGGDEKIACSKKCKKVTKFSIMLRRNSEADVLRAFEGMLRKKSGKKSIS